MLIKGSEVAKKLRALSRGHEAVINGQVWLRLEAGEWKVSPKGLLSDYDDKASFVSAAELPEEFPLENVFQFDEVP